MRQVTYPVTVAVLLALTGSAGADDKARPDRKEAQPDLRVGPPPGKGWRKGETPTPTAPPALNTPKKPGTDPTPAPPGKKMKLPPAGPTPADPPPAAPASPAPPQAGIGKYVSQWARSGITGVKLAAKIHELQAARATTPKTPPAPTIKQPEPAPPPPTPKKKKGAKADTQPD